MIPGILPALKLNKLELQNKKEKNGWKNTIIT